MAGRVTQLVVEAVIAATDANVRVTQVAVEAVIAPDSAAVRTTQIAVEAVISPTSSNLVVSHLGLEVARTGDQPNVLVSQTGIEVAWEIPKGTFPLLATIFGEVSSSFSVGAVIQASVPSSTTADALLLKTFSFGKWVDDGWVDPPLYSTGVTLDAVKIPGFFVHAYIGSMPFWTVDAIFKATVTGSLTASAIRLGTRSGSFALNANIKRTMVAATTVDAIVMPVFTVSSLLLKVFPGSFTAGAVLRTTVTSSFGLDAMKAAWFHLDAFIPISVNAWLDLGFHVSAVIKATIGVPAFQPLLFPGTSQTLYGNTANALTPLVPIAAGELLTVRVVVPPLDGGDLGAFNTTLTLNYGVTASPGEYVLRVLPGQYYIYSSRGNVYRPGLNGSGSYSSWSVSTLQITLDAFVQPVFRVDAELCWHFEFTATADAWLKRTWLKTLTLDAFVQPYLRVDAELAPMHFTASAWIRTDFTVDAWIIRRITGSFSLDAFRQPSFRVNAIKRRTQARTMAVSSWITNPVYGAFHAEAMVGWYLTVDASVKLVKYRRFTASAVLLGPKDSSQTIDAFVHPYFFLDASIFRREFFLQADIFGEVTGSFTVEANFVWTWVTGMAADAFILPWFTIDTLLLRIQETSVPMDAALVWKMYGDFTLQAGITGFQTNAVIHRPDMGGVFTFYAWKIESIPQKTFIVSAEKYDPEAYWDPETETWLHIHFHLDAQIVVPRIGTISVDASIAIDGLGLFSFPVGARIHAPEVGSSFWVEADLVVARRTVVYEGSGRTERVLSVVTERLSFPGTNDSMGGGSNRLSSIFFPAIGQMITLTIWDWPAVAESSIGVIADGENLWANNAGAHSAQGLIEVIDYAGTVTINAWPAYPTREHHVYAWTPSSAYEPLLTGEGMVAYRRYDDVVMAYPAPTLDAFIVGTEGEPWTIDAEIVDREKVRSFLVAAEKSRQGEVRGQVEVGAYILGVVQLWIRVDACLADHGFSVNALVYHPSMTLDAYIQPFFAVSATIFKTMSWYPLAPFIDAVIVLDTKTGTMTVQAEMSMVGELRGQWLVDSVIQAEQGWRIYLSAQIGLAPTGVSIDAYIAQRVTLDAYIQPHFSLDANIRGSAYIIFPDDGGDPTDPYGNPPMIGRSFNVKIEAFIPDEVPVGNDAEIERLIWLILEAEAELEAMYCAYTHYSSQDQSAVTSGGGSNPNQSGTGRLSTLPDSLSQIGYPGAGDIDDCWAVATIWAANAAGYPYQPNMTVFRREADNPDRPGPTGGNLDDVMRGARGCYPGAHIRRYHSTSWDGFISLLKAGWVASLAIRSSALPANLHYGFHGLHQVGVAYQNGSYFIMNPLQHNGDRPDVISGADLRRAARGYTGGTISACLFS
jgi:hypothetical protein